MHFKEIDCQSPLLLIHGTFFPLGCLLEYEGKTIYVLIINSLTIYTSLAYNFYFFLEKSHFQSSWLTLEELFKTAFMFFLKNIFVRNLESLYNCSISLAFGPPKPKDPSDCHEFINDI